ncbi:TPA_asm: hypothetical protein [ssRNA phage Esthiorhiza.2_52]|uniref:Uncharacterized protein n=2 Tax=Fiersviridae TaxID=2842319 RepID=A0A8S5L2D6_9VIRU|nr:hypothetical protein QIL42_gp1 [ssRNA phage Esthiorhiza.2_52]QDH90312.1 MAG: hypothetical protein H2RhizoLitter8532_000004 [Leviviridae sp.]DAD51776.1 TPA_asm: hypothetical protein [ssRNA phage Esthiorhiza.2_52]
MEENLQKKILIAEIGTIREDNYLGALPISDEELSKLDVADLRRLIRDLEHLLRSLGANRNRDR